MALHIATSHCVARWGEAPSRTSRRPPLLLCRGLNDKSTVDTDTLLERAAAETFLKRLTPKREDVTYVIHIGFASEDPNKAARIPISRPLWKQNIGRPKWPANGFRTG